MTAVLAFSVASTQLIGCGEESTSQDVEIFDDNDAQFFASEDPILHAAVSTGMPATVELRFFYAATPLSATSADSYCNGLSLSAHWILTAAHCLKNFVSRDGVYAQNRLQVRYTQSTGTKITTYRRGRASYYLHPNYDSSPHLLSGQQNDFALIRVYDAGQTTVSNAMIYFDDYQPWNNSFVGQSFSIFSYGPGSNPANDSSYGCDKPAGTKRSTTFWLDRTRSPGNSSTKLVGAFDTSDDFSGMPKLCPGDSGSTWAMTFHAPAAFAITSGWYDPFWIFGDNRWIGVLIRPKWDWFINITANSPYPLACSRITDHRNNNTKVYRQCREQPTTAPTDPSPPSVGGIR